MSRIYVASTFDSICPISGIVLLHWDACRYSFRNDLSGRINATPPLPKYVSSLNFNSFSRTFLTRIPARFSAYRKSAGKTYCRFNNVRKGFNDEIHNRFSLYVPCVAANNNCFDNIRFVEGGVHVQCTFDIASAFENRLCSRYDAVTNFPRVMSGGLFRTSGRGKYFLTNRFDLLRYWTKDKLGNTFNSYARGKNRLSNRYETLFTLAGIPHSTLHSVYAYDTGSNAAKQWADHIAALGIPKDTMIVILPDNDDVGRKYAHETAGYFQDAGYKVKIIELPNLPSSGDYVDWRDSQISTANGIDEVEVFRQLLTLVASTPQYEPAKEAPAKPDEIVERQTFGSTLDAVLNALTEARITEYTEKKLKEQGKHPSPKEYTVILIQEITKVASIIKADLAAQNGQFYCWSGTHWKRVNEKEFRKFLRNAALRAGVPAITAQHYEFIDGLVKQFHSAADFPKLPDTAEPMINLKNGTLIFRQGQPPQLKPFDKNDGLTYCLPYSYESTAECPKFDEFLNRCVPDKILQLILLEYISYVFCWSLNLEKVLILHGTGANGKSVFLNIVKRLIDPAQVSEFTLENITKRPDYRAQLANYLLNVNSEINGGIGADIFKKVASREPLDARHLYGKPITINRYATLLFACNLLPREVENTDGFFRRFLIIPFEVQIPEAEQNPNLAMEIIEDEMSGVLNRVVSALETLLSEGKFRYCEKVRHAVADFRIDTDSVLSFLQEAGYQKSVEGYVQFSDLFQEYRNYCNEDGYRAVSKKVFSTRLRNAGYEMGNAAGNAKVVYVAKS
ncbi:MAG: phage/plasmid primase, P4 family [Planctomycetaceae bacterium]|nr:phage/plasmid primase, P4 family [Planctomycetaceae bacterium]